MKSFKEMLGETVDKIKSEDEQNFVDKHIVAKKDHPVAKDDQFVSNAKKAKRPADHDDSEEVYEETRKIECEDCGAKYDMGEEHECSGSTEESWGKKKKPMAEEEMSDAQMKKREEIVKSMKDKMGDFKKRYGDKAKDVMYATATKMAMKEEIELIDEAFTAGVMKLKDGSTVKLAKEEAQVLNSLFGQLNTSNKKKMEERMMKDTKGFNDILKFAKEAV